MSIWTILDKCGDSDSPVATFVGVVERAVIPCDGTVEIGRLDAVNPPHTLVCK